MRMGLGIRDEEKGERRKEKGERSEEKGERRKEKGERRKEKGARIITNVNIFKRKEYLWVLFDLRK